MQVNTKLEEKNKALQNVSSQKKPYSQYNLYSKKSGDGLKIFIQSTILLL